MLHFYDRAGFLRALTLDLDPALRKLLAARIGALTEELLDYTEFLIVQPGDTDADIVRHIGLSPLVEPIDGKRFGEPGFHPHWDWLADHDGWYELLFTFGSAFAYLLLIEKSPHLNDDLRRLCVKFATGGL